MKDSTPLGLCIEILGFPQGRSASRRKAVTYALEGEEAYIAIIGIMSTFVLVRVVGLKVTLRTLMADLLGCKTNLPPYSFSVT